MNLTDLYESVESALDDLDGAESILNKPLPNLVELKNYIREAQRLIIGVRDDLGDEIDDQERHAEYKDRAEAARRAASSTLGLPSHYSYDPHDVPPLELADARADAARAGQDPDDPRSPAELLREDLGQDPEP